MQLSIIIVNYNVASYLELCLDSVSAAIAPLNAEIIVVDNASTDASVAMVKDRFPEVCIIENSENLGFSKANNQGVEMAQGEYICILNPDTVMPEDIFVNLLDFSKQKEKIGAVGVQLIDGIGAFLPESKRMLPTPKVSFNKFLGDGSAYYATHIDKDTTKEVAVLVGAFMFMKRAVYQKVNGFDERYFMYGEDIDLSYTIQQSGFTNFYLGEQRAIHFKGESTTKDKVYNDRFYGAMELFYNKYFKIL